MTTAKGPSPAKNVSKKGKKSERDESDDSDDPSASDINQLD